MDKCTEDTEDVADNPTKRKRWSKGEPPLMRILIVGKSVSENSRVGNLILGRSAFDSEAPPDVVERVGGRLKDRHVTLINCPHLLNTHISDDQITQMVRECVSLSDPGPHVVLLLLQHQQCSAEDQERVEKLQDSFSERLLQHTLVLSTQEPTEPNQILQKIIQKCSNRHVSLQTSSSADHLLQAFEDIEQSNEGRHLITAAPSGDSQCSTVEKQDTQILSDCERLNVLVCGSDGSLKSSISELILQHTHRRSESVRTDMDLHGRLINVLELPALFNTGLSEEEVMRQTLRCVSCCHPGVHAFLLIIPDAPLNNEDRAEMEEIQKIFSSRINKHIMILIMQNSEHQTAELNEETQAVIQSFGGRHHHFSPETQVSTLMGNIEKMLEENRGGFYSTETFLEAQMKKMKKYEEMKKKLNSHDTHLLTQGSTESEDELRIVLLGKTGVGKSSTGNTILGRKAFKAEDYFESVTKQSQRETREVNGRRITVIDTPGVFDTELSNEEIQREIRHCISMILPGPHVFLLLIPLGQRFTKEEETSVKIIQETFGEHSLMFTMVLFTKGDSLKNTTIDQCLDRPGSVVRKLIEACGNRFHVFNNNQPEDQRQVSELLEKIDNMVKTNGGSFYSCKMFREMEREKQEQQMKILMDRVQEAEEEKERMKMMMEEEEQKQEKERKRREEELKRERETFRNEIEEIRKTKEKLQIKYETETDRLMKRIETERKKREEENTEREEKYKTQIVEKETEMKKEQETFRCEIEEMRREKEKLQIQHETETERLMKRIEDERESHETERKRREDEFNQREERYKKEKEEIQDELKSERERFKNEIKELKQENENVKKERENLQLKHQTDIEELMNKIKTEREIHETERKREEEFNEREEKYKREIKEKEESEEKMQETMKRERQEWEKLKQEEKKRREEEQREFNEKLIEEKKQMEREKEELQSKHEEEENKMKIQIEQMNREREELMKRHEEEKERMKMMMEEERQNQETERKRREEELKREIREEEKHQREMKEEMKRERETFRHEMEEIKREKENLKTEYETETDRLKNKLENEKRKCEEEHTEREEKYKAQIKEKMEEEREMREEMKRERERLKHETEQLKTEKEKLQTRHNTDTDRLMNRIENERESHDKERKRREEEFKEREEQYKIQMSREREEWEKQIQEEKKRREEDEKEKQILDEQIQKLKSEMQEIIKEKEKLEINKQEQLEDSEKRLKEERKTREDQQKTNEENLKLLEEQHQEELKRRRVEWREEYDREKEEKICSETDDSLQGKSRGIEATEGIQHLFYRLHLNIGYKLRAADVLQLSEHSLRSPDCYAEGELIQTYIQKLLMMDYRARDIRVKETRGNQIQQRESDSGQILALSLSNTSTQSKLIHPMDVQMAVFHRADGFLKQLMVTKLSQCQFALPLLVPDPETQQIEFPLWTFRQINKSWKIRNTNNETISQTQPIYKAQTPMVFFFRFGSVSSSKSQLMNSLINDKHNTFFHRNCPGSSRSRVLMDGVVEIAWFCPSGADDDKFSDCVAFCNLHGDAGDHEKQWRILTEMASVNVLLLPGLNKNDRIAVRIQNMFSKEKPLICLLSEDQSTLTKMKKRKYKIGLKDRNQADVSEELMIAINDCLSESSSTFRLEDVSKHSDIRVDEEDDEDCRRGRAAAQQMISLLEEKKLTEIKESFLPHQGKLWHQWSQKNKELHRPQAEEIEMDISRKQTEMKKIRQQQHESDISVFIKVFVKEINSHNEQENIFFLKCLKILLDEYKSADLSALHHKYYQSWSIVMKLKTNHNKPEQLKAEETELERISEDLQAAAFGLEHIMREIGQIYESCSSVKENKKDLPVHFSSLPSLAAEMMISGFPLELMDGDAAHVPLVWISAVFDQLVQKLGDQTRVFVLSVLGIQSSGKSTMLNAMFGLQFAVSAGRCTRGAFMQLVKVSEEMKTQMNCDYILVVDTEGLRALELAGRSTRDHDNELATFVVGVANLTLINIFGENPSEMQDVLQIVVQAFMRMKNVRLNPSCVFVHQNVSDVTARKKNIEGRRRLLETLDNMTKLASEEEDSNAERFSDVIRFDVQNDVKYFAQLWEGSPPMAPPNPNYCDDIQELKETIITHASKSHGLMLIDLKYRINDLFEALLNGQFVFSFRNSLEVATYRKLETEYSKWFWSLCRAMSEIENKLHNNIENKSIHEVDETDLQEKLKTNEEVKKSMTEFFEKDADADILIHWRTSFEFKIKELEQSIVRETKRRLNNILQQRDLKEKIDDQRTHHENTLYEKSKELALKLKGEANDEETLKKEFDLLWKECMKKIISNTHSIKDIDIMRDLRKILSETSESAPAGHGKENKDIFTVSNHSDYVKLKKSSGITGPLRNVYMSAKEMLHIVLYKEDEAQIRSLISDIAHQTEMMIQSFNISKLGYNTSHIQQLTGYIKARLVEHDEGPAKFVFKKQFFIDLVLSICKKSSKMFTDQHRKFREDNDPVLCLEKKKEEHYRIFQKHCHGATSAAIFGEIICQKMKEAVEETVCKKTARDLADEMRSNCESLNGNRSNLEKHILKTLAEEEDFDKYINYINNPKDHFKSFIRDEVSRYIRDKFSISVLPKMKENIKLLQQKIMNAAHQSTEHVQVNSGDVGLWLKSFTQQLSDQLIFSEKDLSGVKHDDVDDFRLLEDVIRQELPAVMSDISSRFKTDTFPVKLDYKFRPDELLIDHFCQCCWVQCPFCGVTCTNTIENHDGDHSVPFHRVFGLNGQCNAGTRNLCINICTSAVASDQSFYPTASAESVLWGEYRRAGGVYADWSITPDLSELPYWKWFVCRFQKDLEKEYSKTFEGSGKIPDEWRRHTKQNAVESLDQYI